MAKKLLILAITLLLLAVAQGQAVQSKKCKTCGKPLKECPYKGKHPQQHTTSPGSGGKPSQKPTTTPPPAPTVGSIFISSTPSGAAVKVDGSYKGETPLTLEKKKPGSYTVTFSAEGYESTSRTVGVTAGNTTTCHADLKKKQQPQQVATTTTTSSQAETFTVNGVSFNMIRVEGGGSGTFYIGETEVTQALWQAVMGSNPSYFKGSQRPVEQVSWSDCKEFIRKLNARTGQNFRLPTEAEWEYAAKGGNKSRGYEYSGCNSESLLEQYAWYGKNAYYCGSSSRNSDHPDFGTHAVKTRKPNELEIYDMSGNVCEWCEDLYSSSGSIRVLRGGSWSSFARGCRVSHRGGDDPSIRDYGYGFRLALSR